MRNTSTQLGAPDSVGDLEPILGGFYQKMFFCFFKFPVILFCITIIIFPIILLSAPAVYGSGINFNENFYFATIVEERLYFEKLGFPHNEFYAPLMILNIIIYYSILISTVQFIGCNFFLRHIKKEFSEMYKKYPIPLWKIFCGYFIFLCNILFLFDFNYQINLNFVKYTVEYNPLIYICIQSWLIAGTFFANTMAIIQLECFLLKFLFNKNLPRERTD